MITIALSGGCGERLWPFSSVNDPKQLLNFHEKDTFLKIAAKTYQGLSSNDKFFFVTSNRYKERIKQNLVEVSPSLMGQVLIEPYSRNTLPAIAWAVRHLLITKKAKPTDTVLVVPTDHMFSDHEALQKMIKSSEKLAESGKIVAYGIQPKRVETGYGYIRKGQKKDSNCYGVDSFIEKPNAALAEKFIANEDWLWNVGLYLFRIDTFLEELESHAHSVFHFINAESHHEDYVFRSLSSESIDKGLIEKTTNLVVCELSGLEWADMGSWESIYRHSNKDENENVKLGKVTDIDTEGCIIISKDKAVTAIGVEDLLIVNTEEMVLIAKRTDTEKIKGVLEKLKKEAVSDASLSI